MQYSLLFAFLILVFPVIATVAAFKIIITKYVVPENLLMKYFLQGLCVFILLQLGLVGWTLLDMQYFDFNDTCTAENIVNAYKSLYLELLPATIAVALFMVFINSRYHTISVYLKKYRV
jgi:ABC-type sulfate transport system permease component